MTVSWRLRTQERGSSLKQVILMVLYLKTSKLNLNLHLDPGSDLVITSVETCLEVPDSQDDKEEHEEIPRREVEVAVEKVDLTQLRISPEVPPASGHQRLTLVKFWPESSVYKILNTKKSSIKKGKSRLSCKIEGCKEQAYGRSGLYRHYSYAHFKQDILGLIGGSQENCPYCGIKFQKPNDAVGHVGCVHKKLLDFLPKRLHIKSNFINKDSKPKSQAAAAGSSDQLY